MLKSTTSEESTMEKLASVPTESAAEKNFTFDVPTAKLVGSALGILFLILLMVIWVGWYTKQQEAIRGEIVQSTLVFEPVSFATAANEAEIVPQKNGQLVSFENSTSLIKMVQNGEYPLFTATILVQRSNPDDPNLVDLVAQKITLGQVNLVETVVDSQAKKSPEYKAAESTWVEAHGVVIQ